jgi:sec-independent protein translocase protein TatC
VRWLGNKNNRVQYEQLTLVDHLHELRNCLFVPAAAFLIGGTLGYIWHNQLIGILRKPFNETLYYGTPAGNFNFIMKICLITGLAMALPVLVYKVMSFIRPALPSLIVAKTMRRMTLLSFFLALSGLLFAFFIMVPMSLHFFAGFKVNGISPLISADSYLSFVANCLLSFMIIFQIPLVMSFIDRIRPIPPGKMWHNEKYVIVGALALALILPFTYDPVTQFIVAVPIIVLYNLSILLIVFAHRRQKPVATATPITVPSPLQSVPSILPETITVASHSAQSRLIEDVIKRPPRLVSA